ncbi:MAB_1171c family putative transporter [Streptomyces sp. NBC_01304]|uniref:MAB_1171c family putative transporter n=1 Tax=Streptomyces sp. NBC_01304 TaxID=2903818 RepID=UPI002E0F8BF3|nr:hypothetical protein OG430_48075 [Streptomyces sp. NBC_01304]
MIDFLAYAVAATMTGVAVWRSRGALAKDSDTRRRALWGCFAGFALALWLKTPAVKEALNTSPATDISILVKHYVSVIAILSILTFVVTAYGRAEAGDEVPRHVLVSRWIQRLAYKTAFAAMLLMTVMFFTVVNRSHPSDDFIAEHSGQWGATAYMTIFYLFLGAASAVCGYQWTSAARRAETRLLRIGLALMAFAMALGVLYVVTRTAYLWVTLAAPASAQVDQLVGNTTDVLQQVLFFFFALGASVPTTNAANARWGNWRALQQLYPLWRDLMTAIPQISFDPPGSRLRELTRIAPPLDVRLDRWVQDIADAVEQLRHFSPPGLLEAAEDAVVDHLDEAPAAEAFWIKAALVAVAAGERDELPSGALPDKPIGDSGAEATWLLRVQGVYVTISDAQARELLHAARESSC